VAPTYHNLNFSPLLRLPEEILLLVMDDLDAYTLRNLRHTSRVFLRLFGSSAFKEYHLSWTPGPHGNCGPWQQQDISLWMKLLPYRAWQRGRHSFSAAFKYQYCRACWEIRSDPGIRENPRYRSLISNTHYCTGCHATHRAARFSPSQRDKPQLPSTTRECIGLEGHVRVCEHVVIRWSDIEAWRRRYPSRCRSADPGGVVEATICSHPSHATYPNRVETAGTGRGGIRLAISESERGFSVWIRWEAHIRPWEADGAGPAGGRQPTAAEMRPVFRALERAPGPFLTASLPSGQPLHMFCFDPNSCSCLRYEGREKTDLQVAPPAAAEESCRTDPARDVFRGPVDDRCRPLQTHEYKLRAAGGFFRPTVARSAAGDWIVGFERGFCLKASGSYGWNGTGLERLRINRRWFSLLDPDSYGLEEDEAGRNLLWCGEETCANYYRRSDWHQNRDRTLRRT